MIPREGILRGYLLMSPYALKRCVIPGLPERRIVRGLVSDVCPGRGPLTSAREWLLTYPPSAWSWSRRWEGAAAKSQAGRCQRAGTSLEALSGALTAQGSLPVTQDPLPRASGVCTLGEVSFAQRPRLFSSGALAFAQRISVELFVDFALFKQPHEFWEDCWQVTL